MEHGDDEDAVEVERLVLGDLLNHVLDKGVVISGTVTISIADVDLLMVDLRVLLTSGETAMRRSIDQGVDRLLAPETKG